MASLHLLIEQLLLLYASFPFSPYPSSLQLARHHGENNIMALPVVQTLQHCTDFNTTVAPFLYQFATLPDILLSSATNLAALKQLYLDTNPLVTAVTISLVLAPVFLIVSEVNKNYSQVDRVWSILPTLYNLHYALYAHLAGLHTERLDAIAVISTIWSVSLCHNHLTCYLLIAVQARLTYNYFRKGGYSIGSEDYRWAIVKDYVGPIVMFLFNVVFISLAQSLLLVSITAPTYILLLTERLATHSGPVKAWTVADTVAGSTLLLLIGISYVADQQQWDFHQAKADYQNTAKVPDGWRRTDLDPGFLHRGLFAYSRHPNFAAEQSVWGTLYLWSCLATRTWHNWTGFAAASYLILFQASTWLTELLSAQKYPEYKQYQKQVGKFVPVPGYSHPTFSGHHKRISNGSATKEAEATHARERYDLR
jgi:steroid 5-alpha reductase family enzyme